MLSSRPSIRWTVVVLGAATTLMCARAATPGGAVLYVDDDAPLVGDGLSWDTAYRFLQDALATAAGGGFSEIRVGQGTYTPDLDDSGNVTPGDRAATFQLVDGVTLRGGYLGAAAGKGMDPDERDVLAYETILSGDLLGDDGPGFANDDENSYHVVTGSGTDVTAVMDGFTIRAGNANVAGQGGGGMSNESGSPTVLGCTFSGNRAFRGGGMYITDSTPTVIACAFIGNCATERGGGIAVLDTAPAPVVTVRDCTFIENMANAGGGLAGASSSSRAVDCTFVRNSANTGGGAARCTLVSCTFIGNTATSAGGALSELVNVVNCTIVGNAAFGTSGGGGLATINNQGVLVSNSTFFGNTSMSVYGGGAMSGDPTVVNCILWQSTPDHFHALGRPIVTYSDVQGGQPGAGNIDADPLFISDPGPRYWGPRRSPR